jgi:hypothetical protein
VFARDEDGCLLHFDDAAAGALFQFRNEGVDLLAGLNELDFDGKVIGDIEEMERVEAVCRTETGNSLEDAGAVNAGMEEKIDQAVVDGNPKVLGAIAKVNGDFDGFA